MKNKSSIKNVLIMMGVSVVIISIGILVPFALIALKSSSSNLPHGKVDSANIQPYGAATINIEKSFLAAMDTYTTYFDELERVSNTWVATKANNFAEIGIQQRIYEDGGSRSPEFINELDNIITNNVGESGFGGKIVVSSSESIDTDAHPVYLIRARDNTTNVAIDAETGIPIRSVITVITPNFMDRDSVCHNIVELYREYTGLDFLYLYSDSFYEDGYDSNYLYQIESTDHSIRINIEISSGWYWTPPDSTSGQWQPTDNYIWLINIYSDDAFSQAQVFTDGWNAFAEESE